MRKTKIAVAGAGLIGRRHIELIQASRTCELSGIVDTAPGAAEIARQAGVPLHRTLGDLFGAGRPDGVIIATPNAVHVEHALECIRVGVAVLVEKPVADTVEGGRLLCEAVERAGAVARVLVGHHRRHSPILVRACEVVRQGTLGRIVAGPFIEAHRLSVQAEWKAEAVRRISRLSSDAQWIAQSKADLAKIRMPDDPFETPKSADMILLKNDEWLVYRSIAGKEDWRFDDLFIAKGSDGKWYYSTFHFCIGLVVLNMHPQVDSLEQFRKAYFLREFSGDPASPMPRTWRPQDGITPSTVPARGDGEALTRGTSR